MSEIVKQAYNSNANKNCAHVITKQHNNKQMQKQANAIRGKQNKVYNFITLSKLEQADLK
jgi:hypothetical protein